MSSEAFFTARNAAVHTGSGSPTKVTTVRFVAAPGSTSRSFMPSTDSITSVIYLMTAISRPSLKLGTHSIICFISLRFKFCANIHKNSGIFMPV